MDAPRWDPWAALRARPSALLVWQPLSGGHGFVEVDAAGREVIVLDPGLGRRERRAVLAHELIHLERRLLPHGTPGAVVAREEFQVRRETARRLVPPGELLAFVEARLGVGPVDPDLVADEFDVPVELAAAALGDALADRPQRSAWG